MSPREPRAQPTSSRGRPRGFDADEVLTAAMRVFWLKGYRTATTRDLEAATGLSQSSLYNTFGSKWGLLEEALERYERQTSEHLIEPLETSADGLDALMRFFTDLAGWVAGQERRGCLLTNMMVEDGGATPVLRSRIEAYRRRVRSAFLGALARAEASGELTPGPPAARADVLLGLVMGLNVAARGDCAPDELEALVDSIVTLVAGWRVP